MKKAFTILELLIAVAIIGILAVILIPNLLCYLEKSRVARITTNVKQAAVMVEQYMLDNTAPPRDLEDAYDSYGLETPPDLLYCSGWYSDPDSGHGNDCDFYDEDNPGVSNPGDTQGIKYIIRTPGNLTHQCCEADFIWAAGDPTVKVVKDGEWEGPLPGRFGGQ
jgi:prepilin-type N-terminal cleavage/methylation domain-containing protein